MSRKPATEHCQLCGRRQALTFHHLIPRKLHRRQHFRKRFSAAERQAGVHICRPCHSGLHRLYDEMTLGREFNTLEKLKQDPKISRHVAWVARQRRA